VSLLLITRQFNLHEVLGNFYFRANNLWSASRKHIPRRLEKIDPALHQAWVLAFNEAFQGNADKVAKCSKHHNLGFFVERPNLSRSSKSRSGMR
jgi:hypothetical protein